MYMGLQSPANPLLVMWLALFAWGATRWHVGASIPNTLYVNRDGLIRQ